MSTTQLIKADVAGCDGAGTAQGRRALIECAGKSELNCSNIGQTGFLHPLVSP